MILAAGVVVMVLGCGKCGGGEKIGVSECDEYFAKYEKCIQENVQGEARAGMEEGMKQMRKALQQASENDAAKGELAEGCKQALESARAGMAAYNCSW